MVVTQWLILRVATSVTSGTVAGIYERTKAAIEGDKPLVFYGMVNGEQSFSPIVGYGGVESETSVFVSFFPVTLHISNTDEITM